MYVRADVVFHFQSLLICRDKFLNFTAAYIVLWPPIQSHSRKHKIHIPPSIHIVTVLDAEELDARHLAAGRAVYQKVDIALFEMLPAR